MSDKRENTQSAAVIDLIIDPGSHKLGVFEVRRSLPVRQRRSVGPFVFFDHMGPALLPADQPVNVRPHPHIGLSTLTWLFDGSMMHRDSLGYRQEILPGEVNWMTAGSGIVHSERSPERLADRPKPLHGIQTWLALPREHEETEPSFQHYPASELPQVNGDGSRAIVIAGHAMGKRSPVAVFSDTLYIDLKLDKGSQFNIDTEHEERALYLLDGEIELADASITPGRLVVLRTGSPVTFEARKNTHLVIIGGAPLDGPRRIWWNFVSSSRERIEQAKQDWRDGRFAKVIDDEIEFMPLPGAED